MSTRMYLLLQVDPGRAQEVSEYIATLPGIIDAQHTSGAYDVIATLEGSTQHVQQCLTQLRRAPGLAVLRRCATAAVPVASPA